MKRSTARSTPRKIGLDNDDEDDAAAGPAPVSAVKRPLAKTRKSSSLRTSFGPAGADDDDDDTTGTASVITPKRTNLSKVAVQRNASKRASLLASRLPIRQSEADEDDNDRPSYSMASLQELRNSTPSTPRDLISEDPIDTALAVQGDRALGFSRHYEAPSIIPSAAEIAEKKARRARLALESQEYISLDPDDPMLDGEGDENVERDERGLLVLKPQLTDKWGMSESRIAQDDEDIMENFDEFTQDGRIALSRNAETEAARRRRQEISDQIAEAEANASDSDSDNSERDRAAVFEAAQTRHGAYAERNRQSHQDDRPRTPPIISPIPTLDDVIERLRQQLADMQSARLRTQKEMEEIQRQRVHLAEEEVRVQQALKETAEKFERLRREKGIDVADASKKLITSGPGADGEALEQPVARQSGTVAEVTSAAQEPSEEEDEEEDTGFVGLGFGGPRNGFGASGMLPMPLREPGPASDSDDY